MKKSELKAFGIIGGDKRQLFLAKSISDCCYDVILGGFDKLKSLGAIEISDIKTAISKSDAIIFPLPSICADGTVNTPFSDNKTRLDEEMISLLKEKPIFVAMKINFKSISAACRLRGLRLFGKRGICGCQCVAHRRGSG